MIGMQACNRMSYQCVPLYDTLGENAVEYIINHSEAVAAFCDSKKLGQLAKAAKGFCTGGFKHVIYWGDGDVAAVEVSILESTAAHHWACCQISVALIDKPVWLVWRWFRLWSCILDLSFLALWCQDHLANSMQYLSQYSLY